MKFIIQTIKNEIVHDFAWTLIESLKYLNWYHQTDLFKYECVDVTEILKIDYDKGSHIILDKMNIASHKPIGTPVGSVEFVRYILEQYYDKTLLPVNVPEELLSEKYTQRKIFNGTEKDIKKGIHYKSNEIIKQDLNTRAKGRYQISEHIDIDSEWRAFVHYNKLVGLQNYSGEFTIFPDVEKIIKMIKVYKTSPVAYTLDVGINKSGTFVIECHDFFSCGLYGFADYRIYPNMLQDWFNEFIG